MWTLSGFIDEISHDLTRQCRVAAGLGLRFAEIRSAWGTNIGGFSGTPLWTAAWQAFTDILKAEGIEHA